MTDLSKRQFLKVASSSASAVLLAACSSQEPVSSTANAGMSAGVSAGVGPELNESSVPMVVQSAPGIGPQLIPGATASSASATGGPASLNAPSAGAASSGGSAPAASGSSSTPATANLKSFLRSRATLALPMPPAVLPQISWAGPFGDGT